jgi:hypothetical protein
MSTATMPGNCQPIAERFRLGTIIHQRHPHGFVIIVYDPVSL